MTHIRTSLLKSTAALVERVDGYVAKGLGPEEFSPDFQIAFPYRGAFRWHVGTDVVVTDPNQVLFVRGGEPFRVGEARREGFGEFIVTPEISVMRGASEAAGFDLERHPLFAARSCRITAELQLRAFRLLHQLHGDAIGQFEATDRTIRLLTDALRLCPPPVRSLPTTRLIGRTKELLDAHFRTRLPLEDVAAAVGASPAYLTDVFRRFEGIPLHAYLTQLRLRQALFELPDTKDLTGLALNLGFSSHSHFTFAFRRAFGCTPSQFRKSTRRSSRIDPLPSGDVGRIQPGWNVTERL